MISQGQLFPFEELKGNEKGIEKGKDPSNYKYSESQSTTETDGGLSFGAYEKKNNGTSEKTDKSKKAKKYSDETENMGVMYDFIDDPHVDSNLSEDFLETNDNMENNVESFKGRGGSSRNDGMGGRQRCHGHGERAMDGAGGRGWREEEHRHEWRRGRGGIDRYEGQWVPFWVENPNILFYPRHVYEFFPVETMSYNQKLNSVSRLIILLSIIGFLFVRNLRILWIGAICLMAVFLLQYTQNRNETLKGKEGFDAKLESLGVDAPAQAVINAFATDDPSKIGTRQFFDAPRANNPYNNVLITDIVDNPDKLPAPPAYYPETEKEILDKTKEAIQKMNPTFPDMTDKLFASLDDHFEFEQSARQFYSNPATTIPNDQGAFAQFCYGEMISCKEGNQFACARDAPRHNLY